MKRVLIVVCVLIGVVGVTWALAATGVIAMNTPWAEKQDGDKGKVARIQPAQRGELVEIVAAPGTIVPESNVSISARVSAKIIELPHKVGDPVTKGNPTADPPVPPSVLVRLDASDIEASLRAAQARASGQAAQVETARARIAAREAQSQSLRVQLENRQTELQRQESLLASNDVSAQVVDDLRASVKQLEAQIMGEEGSIEADRAALNAMAFEVAAGQADVDRIRDSLTYTTIVSPIDGVVTKVNAEVGEIAVTGTMNNAGTVILEVADLNTMLVEARVDETDIAAVEIGQRAVVRMEAYPDQEFDGVVQTVALARSTDTNDRSQYYEVKVLLDRKGRNIVSGLTADVEIQTERHEQALRVPSQAVLGRAIDSLPIGIRDRPEVDSSRTFTTVVYRLVDGKAIVTPVRVGASDLTHTIILSGLSEGDPVVVGPFKVLESLAHDQALRDETASTQPAATAAAAANP